MRPSASIRPTANSSHGRGLAETGHERCQRRNGYHHAGFWWCRRSAQSRPEELGGSEGRYGLTTQFSECCFDPQEDLTPAELREYSFCFGQVLQRELALVLSFIQKAKDQLRAADVLPSAIKERILHDLRRQSANARRSCEPHSQNNWKILQ
jgi:hypothetical protein